MKKNEDNLNTSKRHDIVLHVGAFNIVISLKCS